MELIILGIDGYGRTVANIARQSGRYSSVRFLDDNNENVQIIGKCVDYVNFQEYSGTGTNVVNLRNLTV